MPSHDTKRHPDPGTGRTKALTSAPSVVLVISAAIITLLVFLPTLSNGFVNWDDQVYIYSNEMIRSMDAGFFRWAFSSVVSGNWHPVTLISHAIDYRIWGLDPWGHHLNGVLIHVVNTVLVGLITARLAGIAGRDTMVSTVAGGIAALLFGLHPLHVESVAWASERKDLLSALFFLGSVYAYLGFRGAGTARAWGFYAASLALMALSLMSKPMAVTLPVVLLILDYYPLGRFFNARVVGMQPEGRGRAGGALRPLVEKLPFFALSVIFSAVAIWAQGQGGALRDVASIGLGERVVTAIKGYSFYLAKAIDPTRLAPYYPYPEHITAASIGFVVSLAVFVGLTVLAVRFSGRRSYITAAWAYYVVVLLPISGIVQVGAMASADRYFYLPGIPAFMLVGFLFTRMFFSREGGLAGGRSAFAVVWLVVAAAVFSSVTIGQIGTWKDSVTLWSHEIERFPDSVPLAYTNRGIAYGREGRVELALADLERAVEIEPGFSKGHYNMATALTILGRKQEAVASLTRAIEANPGYRLAYLKRGELLAETGRYDPAIADFERLITLDPGSMQAYRDLVNVYTILGNRAKAAEYAERMNSMHAMH